MFFFPGPFFSNLRLLLSDPSPDQHRLKRPSLARSSNPVTLSRPLPGNPLHSSTLNKFTFQFFKFHIACILLMLLPAVKPIAAQQPRLPATRSLSAVPPEMIGRTVEQVKLISRPRPLTSPEQAQVLAQIRTHEGDKFEPTTVEGDYQRVYGLRKFSNVEARFEPTATGVIVVFG